MLPKLKDANLFSVLLFVLLSLFTFPSSSHAFFVGTAQKFDTFDFLTTIDNHILSLRCRNLSKAYNEYTSGEFKRHTSFEDFQKLIKKYAALHDNYSIALNSIYYVESYGCYQGIATSRKGERLAVKFLLTEEKGSWKIASLQLFQLMVNKDEDSKVKSSQNYFNTVTSG